MVRRFFRPIRAVARDWRVKVLLQNIIGLLPGRLGFKANEILVNLVRGGVSERLDPKERILKGIENIELLQRHTGFELAGKKVLEVGSGWHGIDLLLFFVLGAEKITALDQNRNLTLAPLLSQIPHFQDPECLRRLRALKFSEDRLKALLSAENNFETLDDLLAFMNVSYLVEHSSGYGRLPIEHGSIDLFFSESVIHRIPTKHLEQLMSLVGTSLMTEDAVFFHRTDQKDINSLDHVDQGLWGLNYLRYSDFVFDWFLSGKLNSQNRLRESDFLDIINISGMTCVHVESFMRSADLEKLKGFDLADRFKSKDPEDVAISASKFIGRRARSGGARELTRGTFVF